MKGVDQWRGIGRWRQAGGGRGRRVRHSGVDDMKAARGGAVLGVGRDILRQCTLSRANVSC
jgi:hypothetical protein